MAKKLDLSEMASKGGKASAASMTPDERKERASAAAAARWTAGLPRATHGDSSHPLKIGDVEIPCYVLDDGRRVITQRGFQASLGMNASGGARRLIKFVSSLEAKGLDCRGLGVRVNEPIRFVCAEGGSVGSVAHGYEATDLADMCDLILDARKAGHLRKLQLHYADFCEILMRSFARVGIIALIDEATGYQYERPRRELEAHLARFLSDSLRRWVRTFPAEYLVQLCRLRGVELRPDKRLPQYFGHLTNNIVYHRLAPGILRRLKDRRLELGSPSNKLHSWLSSDVGVPELHLHLGAVVMLMRLHTDYKAFVKQLDTVAPTYPVVPGLFDDASEWE